MALSFVYLAFVSLLKLLIRCGRPLTSKRDGAASAWGGAAVGFVDLKPAVRRAADTDLGRGRSARPGSGSAVCIGTSAHARRPPWPATRQRRKETISAASGTSEACVPLPRAKRGRGRSALLVARSRALVRPASMGPARMARGPRARGFAQTRAPEAAGRRRACCGRGGVVHDAARSRRFRPRRGGRCAPGSRA